MSMSFTADASKAGRNLGYAAGTLDEMVEDTRKSHHCQEQRHPQIPLSQRRAPALLTALPRVRGEATRTTGGMDGRAA